MLASTARSQMLRSLVLSKCSAAGISGSAAVLIPAAVHARGFRVSFPSLVEATKPTRIQATTKKETTAITAAMGGGKEHMAIETQVLNKLEVEQKARSIDVPKLLLTRFTSMTEVAVSKIFPAGFGWQAASAIASNAGASATSVPFFMMTGFGDLLGVLGGHVGYMALKKQAGFQVNMSKELDTGLWLGSAAFCSGFVWQPTLNACVDLGLSFNASMTSVFGACTLAFFAGLRMFRMLYSPITSVAPNNYANLKADAGLAVAVGGATGCFVGTDVTFADNWLRPAVGIEDGTGDLAAQVIAGSSTALGFLAVQSAQNLTLPKGKNWIDPQ